MTYEFHQLANIFPLIEGSAFQDLVDDIAQHGIREPIWLYEGKILDGRNRYKACLESGSEIKTREYTGNDPLGFVVSLNLKRRHLDTAQRAMVASRLANMRQGERTDITEISAMSQPEAAAMLNVSTDSVQFAKKVLDQGSEALIQKVDEGRLSVSVAATIATIPKEEQEVIVARGEKEILQAAKEIRGKKAEKKKQERIDAINQQIEVISKATPTAPQGLFHVISIDPPWPYEEGCDNSYDPDARRAANPYPEMSLEQITDLIIPAADDCVLWLWTTHKFMKHSFDLLQTWGFEDKVILTWAKDRMGLGRWLRSQSEFCIMAVRGSPVINLTNQTTILNAPLREHSRKPDEFYQMVDSLCVGRKLDYFSREKREGWEQFGNDLDKFTDVA